MNNPRVSREMIAAALQEAVIPTIAPGDAGNAAAIRIADARVQRVGMVDDERFVTIMEAKLAATQGTR
jgi:hypothetical protein